MMSGVVRLGLAAYGGVPAWAAVVSVAAAVQRAAQNEKTSLAHSTHRRAGCPSRVSCSRSSMISSMRIAHVNSDIGS